MNKCKLGDLLEIKHGYAFKSVNYVDKSNTALITLGNISDKNNFQFYPDKATYYGAEFPEEYILEEEDLIMPLTEQTMGLFGNSAFIPKYENITFVLNQRVGKVIPREGKADKYYLHYLLSTKEVREQLENRANGTKQRNISAQDVYDVTVYVPSLAKQKAVGEYLYLIEKKINNNIKIIDMTEKQMKIIFDTWFNLYNYPCNGKMNFINNHIIPNWNYINFGSIATLYSGYSFLSTQYVKNGKYKLYTIKNVQDGFIDSTSETTISNLPNNMPDYCLLKKGDIIMSLTGNVGRVGIVYENNTLLNQRLLKIDGTNNFSKSFIYFYLRTDKMKNIMNNLAHGTSQKNLSSVDLENLTIKMPDKIIVDRYNEISEKAFKLIENKYFENYKLDNLRKYIVPLLMNGQIKIED